MREDIIGIKNEAISRILDADSTDTLEELRINYLGRNGKVNSLLTVLKNLLPDEKKEIGILINETKNTIENTIENKLSDLKETKARQPFDYSIPGKKKNLGTIHLISKTIEEITNIFERIGFTRMRYPEVEWDYFAFGSLNFPQKHPARDEWETFFIDEKPNPKYGAMLLTPHTSSGQVREMWRVKTPPVRMVNIAKCYRRQSDISHYPMFHQFEGLVIDEGINITHLKGTLDYFAKSFYGPDVKTRIRPYHFQFTEPSFEVDFSCTVCKGAGCKLCKAGWLEVGGSGMVHPNVLKEGGIDPQKYTGYAFGWGVERVLMMKPNLNIPDLRQLYSTDLRYLRQF
ncbi:MAG TPA: phenylalanine--tRNA ligase subunit alpha [Patescibacteria group bacterium]|nr:phenylalanine--tRNA ligase subunit alpha [Patescibacteria group bacterium]